MKIEQAASHLALAIKVMSDMVDFSSILTYGDEIAVHVYKESLDLIPSDSVIVDRESEKYPGELQKKFQGIMFFRVLDVAEYNELKKA